jgi:hypothetical protein
MKLRRSDLAHMVKKAKHKAREVRKSVDRLERSDRQEKGKGQ